MAHKKIGLTGRMLSLTIAPLIILSVVMSVYIGYSGYRNMYDEVSYEMSSVCVSVFELLEENDRYRSAKYDFFREEEALFDGITERTGIYITVFEGDERKITTIAGSDGGRAVGTRAAAEVIETVIGTGSEFFSDNVDVNGSEFFGYYMPITDSDGGVTGMVFAGKSRETVLKGLFNSIVGALLLSWLTALAAAVLTMLFSRKMVNSLFSAERFLEKISHGDTEAEADKELVSRRDEIGNMGRSAVKLQRALKQLISTDPLTGLYNRRACGIKLNDLRVESEEKGTPFVAALGDIDFFKRFNDNYGHDCGDAVLTAVAALLREGVGDKGFVTRWGGEEFLIIFKTPYLEAKETLNGIADCIRAYRCKYNGQELSVTMTFGISEYMGGTIDALVKTADDKLYYGKNNGRNRIIETIPEE